CGHLQLRPGRSGAGDLLAPAARFAELHEGPPGVPKHHQRQHRPSATGEEPGPLLDPLPAAAGSRGAALGATRCRELDSGSQQHRWIQP
ncbi:unnamed protein product, partial [Symbiodinium sp. KB8]